MDKIRDLFWAFKCILRLYLIVINGLSPIRTDLDSLTNYTWLNYVGKSWFYVQISVNSIFTQPKQH